MLKKISFTFWSFIFYFFAFPTSSWSIDLGDITGGVLDIDINWTIKQPDNSTYFDPLVEVSLEVCVTIDLYLVEFSFCIPSWNNGKTLDPYGDCRFMLPYPTRVCARVYSKGSTDPAPDKKYKTSKSMICVYDDPMFPIDLNDFDGDRMKHAHNTKVEKSYTEPVKLGVNSAILIGVGTAVPGIGPLAVGGYLAYEGIKNLVDLVGSTINYTVLSNLGCVDIPFAPMPPYYTAKLPVAAQSPSLFHICQKDATGTIFMPGSSKSIDAFCEFGSSYSRNVEPTTSLPAHKFNTHENPSVILSFKNILPRCDAPDGNSVVKPKTTPCVEILNENKYIDSSGVYMNSKTNTLTNDLLLPLKDCINSSKDPSFCIRNKVIPSGDKDKLFRPVCNVKTKDNKFSAYNVPCSLQLLGGNNNISTISGVDYSNFYQIPISFAVGDSKIETKPISIIDKDDNFTSDIILTADASKPTKINVFQSIKDEGKNKIGYFIRPEMPKPIVTSPGVKVKANGGELNIISNILFSTHANPAIVIGLGNPLQQSVIIYGNQDTVYLYLNKFTASVIDSNNTQTNGNKYGEYRRYGSLTIEDLPNDLLKEALTKKLTPDLFTYSAINGKFIYVDGFEVVNKKYIRGGDYICLEGYNDTEEVLVKKVKINTQTIASTVLKDRIIPPYVEGVTDLGDKKFIETTFKTIGAKTSIETKGSIIDPNASDEIKKYKINTETQGKRSKLPIESGLCVPVPRPGCSSITEAKATWPEVKYGKTIIEGKCLDKNSIKIPKRLCQLKPTDYNTAEWSEIIGTCENEWWKGGEEKFFIPFVGDNRTYSATMEDDAWKKLFLSGLVKDLDKLYKLLNDYEDIKFRLDLSSLANNNPVFVNGKGENENFTTIISKTDDISNKVEIWWIGKNLNLNIITKANDGSSASMVLTFKDKFDANTIKPSLGLIDKSIWQIFANIEPNLLLQ